MPNFHRKTVEEGLRLFNNIINNPQIKKELLEDISISCSKITLLFITPEDFLEALLKAEFLSEKRQKLLAFKEEYLLTCFLEQHPQENFHSLTEVKNTQKFNKQIRTIEMLFNKDSKKANELHNIAINKIGTEEKISGLRESLTMSPIGSYESVITLIHLAKIRLGESVGKSNVDTKKDVENQKKLKAEHEKKIEAA